MRLVVGWDGSGHALAALAGLVGLFRPRAVEHVEVVLHVWPELDIPRWADIEEQGFISDDLHQAAAQVAADELSRLAAVLKPLAESVATRTAVGDVVEILLAAVEQSRADMILIVAGAHDPSGQIEAILSRLVRSSTVPTLVVRSAAAAGS